MPAKQQSCCYGLDSLNDECLKLRCPLYRKANDEEMKKIMPNRFGVRPIDAAPVMVWSNILRNNCPTNLPIKKLSALTLESGSWLREHVSRCKPCSAKFLQAIQELDCGLAGRIYNTAKGCGNDLTPRSADWMRKHLASCEKCAEKFGDAL